MSEGSSPAELRTPAEGGGGLQPRRARGIEACAGLALVLVALWSTSRLRFVDPDLFHGLSLAREILREGDVPAIDSFAYTPTVRPVVHHEWGAGLLFYGVVQTLGKNGLVALRELLAFSALALAALTARRRGASWPVLALLAPLVLVPGAASFTTVRAQLVTLLFAALLVALLEADARGARRWIWLWVPCQLLWQNLHGGFVAGFAILLLDAGERILRRRPARHLLLLAAGLLALVPLNPFGFDYVTYLARALTLRRATIGEWMPMWRQGVLMMPLFGLSLATAGYAWWRRGLGASHGIVLVLASAAAALAHARHFSLYLLLWLSFVPATFEGTPAGQWIARLGRRRPLRLATALLAVGAAFVPGLSLAGLTQATIPHGPRPPGRAGLVYPTGAVAYLGEQRFRGNLMVPFVDGAFVTWYLGPGVRVSIDGRYEVAYRPELLDEHLLFYGARPGWEKILERYPTDAVLVPVELPAMRALRRLDGWRLAYLDDSFAIFARRGVALSPFDRRGRVVEARLP